MHTMAYIISFSVQNKVSVKLHLVGDFNFQSQMLIVPTVSVRLQEMVREKLPTFWCLLQYVHTYITVHINKHSLTLLLSVKRH